MRQLLKVYRVRRRTDSEDSDKPARFAVESDDEISEREEVRDSNYVGTDLYWENQFYQVKPFKHPDDDPEGEDPKSLNTIGVGTGSGDDMMNGPDVLANEEDIDITDKEFVMV